MLYKLSEPRRPKNGEMCKFHNAIGFFMADGSEEDLYQILEPVEPELSPEEGLAEAVRRVIEYVEDNDRKHEPNWESGIRDALKRYEGSKKESKPVEPKLETLEEVVEGFIRYIEGFSGHILLDNKTIRGLGNMMPLKSALERGRLTKGQNENTQTNF